ncbi:MAG: chaperone modulatory protein CbpM [Gammaproteobacteria bacterium]|nr:chaperone modulatory protein CbpM [Gammaproteobacteria bacterium]
MGELTQSVRLSTETVITIVECGIVDPRGEQPQQWLFEPQMVTMVQRACRLQRDLELDWPAVALALELIEDLQQLREENQRLRQQLGTLMELDASN